MVSIKGVSGILAVYGAGSKCRKSVTYDMITPDAASSLQTERNPRYHHARRPAWDKALSARSEYHPPFSLQLTNSLAANMEYEPRLMKLTNLLVSKFSDYEGNPVEISTWFRYFAFDMMGELGFNKTYGSVESGTLHPAIQKIHDLLWINTILGLVPWLPATLLRIPFLPNPLNPLKNFSEQSLKERVKVCIVHDLEYS